MRVCGLGAGFVSLFVSFCFVLRVQWLEDEEAEKRREK